MQRALWIGMVLLVAAGAYASAQMPNGTVAQLMLAKPEAPKVNPDGTIAQPAKPVKTQGPVKIVKRPVVPSLQGMSVPEAREKLRQSGLVLGQVPGVTEGGAEAVVATQRPSAGSIVAFDSTVYVELKVPQKKEGPKELVVPSVLTLSMEEARTRLSSAGFPEVFMYGPTKGTVLSQQPEAGSKAVAGTQIRLTFALKENTITIPPQPPGSVWGWYAAGAGVLAVAFGVWWWNRSPTHLPLTARMVALPNPADVRLTMRTGPEIHWSVRLQDRPANGAVSIRGEIEGERR